MENKHYWAVKYLDDNGYVKSYGYTCSLFDDRKPGDITTTLNGKKILWEFLLPDSLIFSDP